MSTANVGGMTQFLGQERAGSRWLPVLGAALAATSLACGTAPDARWTPEYLELAAAEDDPNQNFGMVFRIRGTWLAALALAGSGDGAPGAVYLFEKDGDRWERRQRLVAPDGHPGDSFGLALDLAGSTLVVGAPAQRDGGVRSGIVHVFQRQGGQWAPVARLSSPDPAQGGGFGHHVAFDGHSIVVGEDRASEGWPDNEAVYAFARADQGWRLQATIKPPEDLPAPHFENDSHAFGYYFDIDGDSLAVAAAGADTVVLYQRHGDTWRRHQTFENPNGRLRDPKGRTNERGGAFGRTLDLDGDLLVVGALRADGDVPDAGAAFVYRRLEGAWHLEDRLVAPDGATNDMFGHWVAHDGGLILSGAFRHRVAGSPEFGAAYLFARRQGDWQLIHQLVVPDQPSRRGSAYTVDLHAGTALLSGGRLGGLEATRESTQAGGLYVVDVSQARP